MAQQLRDVAEDMGSGSSTNGQSGPTRTPLLGDPVHTWYTYIQVGKTVIHIKNIRLRLNHMFKNN